MPKVKQPNSLKVGSILHEYACEFTSTPKDEWFCRFCDCLVKSDTRFMVEAHRRSAKHQRGSFHETESLAIAETCFADKLLLVSVCFLILYINILCIPHFSWKRRKLIGQSEVKICKLLSQNFKILGQELVAVLTTYFHEWAHQTCWDAKAVFRVSSYLDLSVCIKFNAVLVSK